MSNEYDVIVVGAGTGGYVAAIRAAQLGLKVAVVEKQKALGGTCLMWGCIPTKALLEHAHALKIVQHAKEWGISLGEAAVTINMAQVHERKDRIVGGLTKGVEFLFKKNKIDWIKGTARLAGQGSVDVFEGDAQTLRARKEIIVATGSAPRSVPGIAIDRNRIITSDEAIHLKEVPKSIVILGSGAVGVEFASIFRRFGSEVTIVELLPRLVPVEDEAVSAELEKSFRKQGINVHTGARVSGATVNGAGVDVVGAVRRWNERHDARRLPACRHRARSRDSGPERRGRRPPDREGLYQGRRRVQDRCAWHFRRWRRDHAGYCPAIRSWHMCRQPKASSPRNESPACDIRPLNYDHVPGCTYCDPEIGSVGLTEREARERGYDVRVGTFPFGVLGRAKMSGETEGFVKIVADKASDDLLGMHMIGSRSTELVAEATLALRLNRTVEDLIRTIHAHPTMAEAIGEAAHATHGAAITSVRGSLNVKRGSIEDTCPPMS